MNREKKLNEVPLAILEVVLIFVLAFASGLVLPVASAADAGIVIDDVETYPGDTTYTSIKINNAENVGVVNLNLSYNPSVVMVIDVSGVDFDGTIRNLEHNETGFVKIGAFQMVSPGLNDRVIIANITLKAVGSTGQSSMLNIRVNEFKYATPEVNKINHTITNGTFRIISPEVTPTPTPAPSNGASDGGDGDGYVPGTPTPTPTSTEKTPAVSGEEKMEAVATPSPTVAPTFTPSASAPATPAQSPSSTIPPPATIEQNQTLMLVIGLIVVSIMAIIIYTAFKRRKNRF